MSRGLLWFGWLYWFRWLLTFLLIGHIDSMLWRLTAAACGSHCCWRWFADPRDGRCMDETFYRHCSGLNWIFDCQLRLFFDEALLNCSPDLIQNCCHSLYGPSLSKKINKVQIYGLVWKCLIFLLYMPYVAFKGLRWYLWAVQFFGANKRLRSS